ncbi:MAG TPA: TonB-dependent receptor [Steroidobacteraceae bacterium]|nr:TonB-dependent receptor [Steroidobacteraceae bacterium]
MRVKSKKAPRGGVQQCPQRSLSPTARPAFLGRRTRLAGAGLNSVAAVVAGILGASGLAVTGSAHAQTATLPPAPTSAQTSQTLQEVVVTATATAVRKLDASYNIVAADRQLILQSNPLSSADILKLSPGIWPEASGGQTGANIEVAGFPSGGDSPFFTNMIEGMPLYGTPSLSFMDSSSLYRLDDTIERVEVVQGGPAAVFGPGQMGATANYILRTGSETPTGEVKATYGNEGLWRVDSFYGFPIAKDWYGSLGGFYRVSKGVRSPQFPSDQGGQFTGTLKHSLDGGQVTFWTRVLDDKNQFIVPVPVVEGGSIGDPSFSAYPGFNALTGSYGSYANQNVVVPGPFGFEPASLSNGRGAQLYYFGSNYDQTIGAWTFHNGFIADGGGLDTNAFFSGANPSPLSFYLYGCNVPEPAGYCNGTTALSNDTINGDGTAYLPTQNIQAIYSTTGLPVSLNQDVIHQGWWFIQKSLQNFADDFRISREIFKGNTLTGGIYLAVYEDNDKWSLGNQMLMTNTPNATPINLSYVQNGVIQYLTSPQGFNYNGGFNIAEHGNGRNIAGYFSDSWRLGSWLLDAGARLENVDIHQRTCNLSNVQLGTATDLYDSAVSQCNGTWDYEHYVRTRPTFTVGANYEFTSNMSAYVRINNGTHYDDFDNGIRGANGNFGPLEVIHNYETGFKFQNSFLYVDVSGYLRNFDGLQTTPTNAQGIPFQGQIVTYGATTHGIDFNGYVRPFAGATLRVLGDWMDGHYKNASACVPTTNGLGQTFCANYDGAPLQRQPKFQVRVTPSYAFPASWGDVNLWLTYEYVGQRYEDQTGQQPLGKYHMLGGGISADVGDNWVLAVRGTNLTNEIALTEGNARRGGAEAGINGVILARPYEGREVNFSAEYKW